MKKIIIAFFALIFIFNAKDVLAQDQYTLTLEKQDGIFMTRQGTSYGYDSHPYYIYKMNNLFAYCIEPGKHISTYTYVGTSDYVDLGFSEELKEKLELIGYYGRDYPGHNNVRYSMAAQALIWELTGVDSVTFWTKQYEQGDEIDISKERNEIMSLVNSHKTLPNFKSSYTANLKRELVINDTNKVLDNYEIVSNGNQDVYIDNNTLHITPKKIGTYSINLKRKSYDEYNTIIFVGKGDNSSQKLGRLHFNKKIETNINITVNGISLVVQKVDENNNVIKLSNIKFKVKNITTNTYLNNTYSTDSNGKLIVSGLDYGEYEIEEVENQLINGYSWNSEKIHIIINDNTSFNYNDNLGNYLEITFKNHSVTGTLEIYKKGERLVSKNNQITYEDVSMINVFFDLYTTDNELVKTVATSPGGYVKIENLKLGKYYLVEKNQLNDYVPMNKIYFEIKQDNQYQTNVNYRVDVKNTLKKGKLEFSKIDSITNKGIANTIIEIYNEFNTLLLTKETDKDGKVVVDNLAIGKYYIKEKEANYYYEKTSEIVPFEIKNDGEVVKASLKNNKIVGNLEVIKKGENYHFINNEIVYEKESIHSIEFNLYDNDDNLIRTIKTDKNGYVKETNLPLGKYYLIEKTNIDKYIDNSNKYYFEIKKDNDRAIDVKLEIVNYLKKGNLEFSKTDLATSEGIPNTIIEIYNDQDMLIFTKKTDELGKVIINDLPIGRYYILEKEANSLYMITNEKVFFEIKENGEIAKAVMTNEKIEIPVPKTSTSEYLLVSLLSITGFLIGIGGCYERKKTY